MTEKPTYEELEKRIQELEQAEPDLKKNKNTLQETEQFMASVFESIQDGISVLNPDLSIRYVNNVMKKWYSEKLPLEGKKYFEAYHDANKPCDPCPTLRCLESGKTEMDIVPGLPGSDAEWLELYSYPIRDDKTKEITGVVEFVKDITKRKKVEEAHRESAERYRTLVENIPGVSYRCAFDKQYTKELISDEVEALTGYPASEFLGNKKFFFTKIIHPEDMKTVHETVANGVEQKKPFTINYRIIRADGKLRWVFEKGQGVFDDRGKVVCLDGVVVDITLLKQTEDSLRKSEEKFRSMMESMKDSVYICSPEYRIDYLNPAMASRIGYDAVGEPCHKVIYNNDKKCAWCIFDQIKKGEHAEYEVTNPIDNRIYSVTNSPIDHSDGNIFKLAMLRDITQKKRIEGKLKKWNEQLEDKIKERTASLEDLNTALRVLLKKREEDKNQIGENIYANFKSLIQPLMNQLRSSLTINAQEDILNILESSIKEMTTPFSKKMSDPMMGLTPTEIQVASLVRDGKTNKEISQLLTKSIRAVTSHRNNIRQKLGLKNKKRNLRTYLLSLN